MNEESITTSKAKVFKPEPDPFEKDYTDQSLQSLYRKMKKTAKARFNCSKRLSRHHKYALWATTAFSLGLIILSLTEAYNFQTRLDIHAQGFLRLSLELTILVLTLLLSNNNFGDRAEKMHRCALELNDLSHKILPACRENTDKKLYDETLRFYTNILNAYENHEDIDYSLAQIDLYKTTVVYRLFTQARYWLGFGFYAILLLAMVCIMIIDFTH
jgi:hypothetical protein